MSRWRFAPLVLGCALVWIAPARADDFDWPAHLEAMKKAIQPGPMHEQMLTMVGDWTTHTRMWMQTGAPPAESDGTSTFTAMFDGRFLVEKTTGSMMGMPYEGMNVYGYHNGTQKYQALWTYSLSTTMLLMNGTVQDDGTVVFEGTYTNDMGQPTTMKVTAKSVDENTMVEKVMGQGGVGNDDGVLMETTYTRVVSAR